MIGPVITASRDELIYRRCGIQLGRGLIIAADPSMARPALACIYVDGRLPQQITHQLIGVASFKLEGDDCDRIRRLSACVQDFVAEAIEAKRFIFLETKYYLAAVERPEGWLRASGGGKVGRGQRGANAKSMMQVNRAAGVIEGTILSTIPQLEHVENVAPKVSEWKRSQSKDLTKAKVDAFYPYATKVKGARINHDDRDAIGIAIYVLERLAEARGVTL